MYGAGVQGAGVYKNVSPIGIEFPCIMEVEEFTLLHPAV